MMRRILVIVLSIAFLFACEKKAEKKPAIDETSVIKNTVILYNTLMAEGYRNFNMNALVQAATEDRATKAYYHMAAIGEGRLRMDPVLKDIQFLKAEFNGPESAAVETREVWDYTYKNIDTNEIAYGNTITYENNYRLVRESGKWLVSDITIMKSEEEKKTDFLPFARPDKHDETKGGQDENRGRQNGK